MTNKHSKQGGKFINNTPTKQKEEINIEPEHNTDSKECWCNPKMEYIEESDSWVIVHNTLLPDESHKIKN